MSQPRQPISPSSLGESKDSSQNSPRVEDSYQELKAEHPYQKLIDKAKAPYEELLETEKFFIKYMHKLDFFYSYVLPDQRKAGFVEVAVIRSS